MTDSSSVQPPCCTCCKSPCCFPDIYSYAEGALTTNSKQVFGEPPPYEKDDPCCSIFLCITCCPLRFTMTLPWCFGATFNSLINCCTHKNKNYLF